MRLTNAFSKKWENHWAALCLWFAYYNFCRIHSTISCRACDGSWNHESMFGILQNCWLDSVGPPAQIQSRCERIAQGVDCIRRLHVLRIATTAFAIGSAVVLAQPQDDAAGSAGKIDKASAYYHYAMAQMSIKKAATSRPTREQLEEAIQHYREAIKADPQSPHLREALSRLEAGYFPAPNRHPPSVYRPPEKR